MIKMRIGRGLPREIHHISGQCMKIGFEGCSYCSYAKTNDQILFSLFYITAWIKTSPDHFKLGLTHQGCRKRG